MYDKELEHELVGILDTSEDEEYETFLSDVLKSFHEWKTKTNWEIIDVEELLNTYLTTYDGALTSTHSELNTISTLILTYTCRQIFKKSNNKLNKVNKLVGNMKGMPAHELISPRKQKTAKMKEPKSLFSMAKSKLMHKYYRKSFLEIAVAKCKLPNKMDTRKNTSHVTMDMKIENPDIKDEFFHHISFSKPNKSTKWNQVKHRTMDPTHILTNLRSQISRHGYHHISTEAFTKVSEQDYNVLPRSIVEDQLDKQSADLAKRFFSKDVERILNQNRNVEEAKFVNLVHNWYEVCDSREIPMYQRLHQMQDLYEYLLQ